MHKERVAEHFIKLNNGINMPMLDMEHYRLQMINYVNNVYMKQ